MSANHDSERLYRKFVAGQSVALFKGILVTFIISFAPILQTFHIQDLWENVVLLITSQLLRGYL